jgi:hypothetical protein
MTGPVCEVRGRRLWGEAAWSRANLLPFLYKLHYGLHIPSALGIEPGMLFMGIVAAAWLPWTHRRDAARPGDRHAERHRRRDLRAQAQRAPPRGEQAF